MNEQRPWIGRRELVVSLVAALVSPLVHGYAFGLQNQQIQIPHLLALQDPSLYPGDALIAAMRTYFSFFWPAVAWLTERLPLEPTFLGLHLVVVFAQYLGLAAFVRGIWPRVALAPLVAQWLVFFGHAGIGYEPLNWIYLTHTTYGTALGLWALAAAVRGRVVTTAVLAGLLFDLHAMQSAYVLLMAAAAFLVPGGLPGGLRPARLALAAFAYALTALPGLVWLLRSEGLAAPADFPLLVRTYFPYHFFPSSFGPAQWGALVLFVLLFGAAWGAARSTRAWGAWIGAECGSAAPSSAMRRALAMAGALLAFWAVGGAWIELHPTAFVIKLHVFRSSTYLYFVLAAIYAGICMRVVDAQRRVDPRLLFALLAACTIAPSGFVAGARGSTSLAAFGLALAGLVGALLLGSRAARGRAAGVGLAAALVAVGLVLGARFDAARTLARSQEPWKEVQLWAARNTPRDALFLTPPYLSGFRIHSRRPVVGEVQDGSAILWSSEFARGWRRWFEDFAGPLDGEDVRSWERLAREWFAKSQAQIEQLGREYGAAYVVVGEPRTSDARRGWDLSWEGEARFDNGVFAVYELGR